MPRTVDEIVAHSEELAKRFETRELPGEGKLIDGAPLRAVREAFEDFALAQKRLAERVSVAKAMGHSWAMIGMMVGTSGEAARQRYGGALAPAKVTPVKAAPAKKAATGAKVVKGKSSAGFAQSRRNSA